jgi:hypothetical protein
LTNCAATLSIPSAACEGTPCSVAVILTLTLGIGMNTGVYTLINAEALRPRVDKDPDTFLHVFLGYARESDHRFRMNDATLGDYVAFRDGTRSLSELAGMYQFQAMLGQDDPQDVRGLLVTCNFFPLHGLANAKLGRLLLPKECTQPGGAPVSTDQSPMTDSTRSAHAVWHRCNGPVFNLNILM